MPAPQSLFLSFIFILFISCNSKPPQEVLSLQGSTMGTTYSVKYVLPQNNSQAPLTPESLQKEIDLKLELVNQQMSTYRSHSELSQFNQSPAQVWMKVSPELVKVVKLSKEISDSTQGAFDVTVGPLVNLWGFGPKGKRSTPPTDEQIQSVLSQVGHGSIEIDEANSSLKKKKPGVYVDLSAVAKGHGVDEVANLLKEKGIENFLVEIGGEMVLSGKRPDESLWNVAIEAPTPGGRAIQKIISLTNVALATSGDYRNYFEKDGKRYSHTIDPRTGRPITHTLASVTVLEKTCAKADAVATALMVLGPNEGLLWARQKGISAYFLVKKGTELTTIMTPGFENAIKGPITKNR